MSARPPASRTLAVLLLLLGIAIAALAIFADSLGYGTGRGFGYYQMIFLIGGLIAALAGLALLVQGWTNRGPDDTFEPEP